MARVKTKYIITRNPLTKRIVVVCPCFSRQLGDNLCARESVRSVFPGNQDPHHRGRVRPHGQNPLHTSTHQQCQLPCTRLQTCREGMVRGTTDLRGFRREPLLFGPV